MATFCDLPNEVVLMIWHALEVEDINHFSVTSKPVYSLVKHLLPEHLELQRRLSTISNDCRPESHFVAEVLKEVLLNPKVARYPSCLVFHNLEICWDESDTKLPSKYTKLPECELVLFGEAVKQCGFIRKDRMSDWINEIGLGNEEPLIALLMTLLPNLVSIQHEVWLSHAMYIRDILMGISFSKSHRSLKCLRTVTVDNVAEDEDDELVHLDILRGYSEMASVEEIFGHHIACDEDDLLMTAVPLPFSSNVTNLSLTECAIHAKPLSEFLLTINGLEHFSYTPLPTSASFEPYWIRTALLAHQRWTLKSLTLKAGSRPKSYMGSLDLFPRLEDLETDLILLVGSPFPPRHDLYDVLPESIKTIKLHLDNYGDDLKDWEPLQKFAKELKGFPKLMRIQVETHACSLSNNDETESRLIKDYDVKGVHLSFRAIPPCDELSATDSDYGVV